MHLQVALNGHDFTAENEFTIFTFIGTATVFSYWPYIVGLILGILALIALIMCCSALIGKGGEEAPPVGISEHERHKRPGAPGSAMPHIVRDDFGFYRSRGYFADREQPSPSPLATAVRTSAARKTFLGVQGSDARGGTVYLSPMVMK